MSKWTLSIDYHLETFGNNEYIENQNFGTNYLLKEIHPIQRMN